MKNKIMFQPVDTCFVTLEREFISVVVVQFNTRHKIAVPDEKKLHPVDGACPACLIACEKADYIVSKNDLLYVF
jgi:hypothetical protein